MCACLAQRRGDSRSVAQSGHATRSVVVKRSGERVSLSCLSVCVRQSSLCVPPPSPYSCPASSWRLNERKKRKERTQFAYASELWRQGRREGACGFKQGPHGGARGLFSLACRRGTRSSRVVYAQVAQGDQGQYIHSAWHQGPALASGSLVSRFAPTAVTLRGQGSNGARCSVLAVSVRLPLPQASITARRLVFLCTDPSACQLRPLLLVFPGRPCFSWGRQTAGR
jgi:hypothetical protein